MRNFPNYLAALVLGAGVATTANAATTPASFPVTATVLSKCSATAATLPFGNYTPGAGALAVNTSISVRCTKNTPYTISLNTGSTAGGTFPQRLMASGGNTLQYNLYKDAAFTTIFGDGTNTSAISAGTGNGYALANAVATTVYGQLPDSATNQTAVPGAYTDTITVTVTY